MLCSLFITLKHISSAPFLPYFLGAVEAGSRSKSMVINKSPPRSLSKNGFKTLVEVTSSFLLLGYTIRTTYKLGLNLPVVFKNSIILFMK